MTYDFDQLLSHTFRDQGQAETNRDLLGEASARVDRLTRRRRPIRVAIALVVVVVVSFLAGRASLRERTLDINTTSPTASTQPVQAIPLPMLSMRRASDQTWTREPLEVLHPRSNRPVAGQHLDVEGYELACLCEQLDDSFAEFTS
jgi:hypothetical protein